MNDKLIRGVTKVKKILLSFGTRPEAIKMAPLVNELKKEKDFEIIVAVTGQHREMLQTVLDVFEIEPDYNLNVMKPNQTLFDINSNIMLGMKEILEKENPDIVLVHGDTSTTYATALSAFYLGIKVGHVEAGLRTYNMQSPFPEEFNRQAVGLITDVHFSPTELAKDNLLKEGKKKETIYVTGNTVIDALQTTVREDYRHEVLEWAKDSKLILLTAHRRENLGEPMVNMFNAINNIINEHEDIKVVYPIHKNPRVREIANDIFKGNERIRLIEPLDVIDFHNIMARSHIILTDSGGIQEEAPSFGIPVLVMRDTTERPEGVEAGTLKLVGTSEKNIYNNFKVLLTNKEDYENMSKATNPYGDGTTSKQIRKILKEING